MVTDYRDWQLPLGRRFRALKLWFVLKAYGLSALRDYIRMHISLAARFAEHVRADARFELPTPPALGLVCFRLKSSNEDNATLMARVVATGKLFLVNTLLGDLFTLRLAVGSPATTPEHIDAAWGVIVEEASKMTPA